MIFIPHDYQRRAIDFVMAHSFCGLFIGMGLGKTVTTLTAVERLLNDSLDVTKVLVIAPKSVAQNTWTDECAKWSHLSSLSVSVVMGNERQRLSALDDEADIYVTNRDNVVWLVDTCLGRNDWPFDMVVLDESTSFKNFHAKRWKALWKVRPLLSRLVLLTGTPAPNGLMDLWPQIKLLDKGERLGKYISNYREQWFHPGTHNGAVVYEYLPNKGAEEAISEKLSDICLSMRSEDYISVPDVIDGGMLLTLPELAKYRKFQNDCILPLKDSLIEAVTAVSLSNKLLQFTSGAVYDDDHTWHPVSDCKMEALSDILDQTHESVLVFYNYRHERERILAEHPDAVAFRGEPDILREWNEGKIRLLLCHPASVGYGLNMQRGGHIIVWFSPTWNLELYEQANARLHRQGQDKPVVIYHLICRGTLDEAVMDAIRSKSDTQVALMRSIHNLIQNA